MFEGQTYRRFGFQELCIGFAGRERDDQQTSRDGGVVTVTYAAGFNEHEKGMMARRILAVLNLTSSLELGRLENMVPLQATESDDAGFPSRPYCRLPGSQSLVIGYEGRCPVHGIFGKNGGFATTSYADELDRAGKEYMARRLVAALNYTRHFSARRLESVASLPELAGR